MFLSEAEAETRLTDLRRRRDELDRLIADHLLYLELGRRLPVVSSVTFDEAGERDDVVSQRNAGGSGASVAGANQISSMKRSQVWGAEVDPASARQHGQALIAAAMTILTDAQQPLHARDIFERLKALGFTIPGLDPVAALNTRLWKRSGPGKPFRRLGDAVYAMDTSADDPV